MKGICEKVVELEHTSDCTLLVCKDGDTATLIALSSYKDWVYAKAVPQEAVSINYWSCNYIFYTPFGLYVFAKNEKDLVEKLKSKKKLLAAIAKLAIERTLTLES